MTDHIAQKIEVLVPDCPAPPPPNVGGIPSWVIGAGFVVGTVVILALIVATAIVVLGWREEKTKQERLKAEGAVDLAKLHKTCDICGSAYKPEADR